MFSEITLLITLHGNRSKVYDTFLCGYDLTLFFFSDLVNILYTMMPSGFFALHKTVLPT